MRYWWRYKFLKLRGVLEIGEKNDKNCRIKVNWQQLLFYTEYFCVSDFPWKFSFKNCSWKLIKSNKTYSNNSRWKKVSAFRFRLGILIWSKNNPKHLWWHDFYSFSWLVKLIMVNPFIHKCILLAKTTIINK